MIQFIENKHGKLVPFRNSKSLCSFQRPLSEAMSWHKMYNLKGQKNACVLGAGGGFHIQYLLLMNAGIQITVYDFDSELVDSLEAQFSNHTNVKFVALSSPISISEVSEIQNYLKSSMPVIMPFRPGWQGYENLYSALLIKMTQREAKILQENWQNNSLDINIDWNMLNEEKNYLTLKNLLLASDCLSSFDAKVLHVFDEIIK